ncbi:hypothetical protein O181_126056 [Austropuccinia psidii MF-1]|uniref:Uncharacterized protein n=1 Tax=Austropuccinia psidii MF-1 TaxID=1389203 RepID=A0A9Q3Q5K8_9BASI|nr:hypothetical protein [Austropuccinia psidii MF-1]
MVHTTNGSNYSVQPDGCGQERGKTKSRSAKSPSRKAHLEDARVAPHSPRAEPFSSGSNRNISTPIQKLVQRSQGRGVGNMPKALAGGHELLLTHQELSGSGEDHKTLKRLEPIVLQRQGQKDKELVEEPKSFIHRPEERVGNDSSFGDRRHQWRLPAPEVSKDKPKGPQKNQGGPKNNQSKGKGKANWHRPYPQGYRIPKLEPSAVESVFNMARTLMEFTAKEKEKMNRTFPKK